MLWGGDFFSRECGGVMKFLSWNVRGLGGFVKRPEVRKLIAEKSPSIVCLQEMKLSIFDDARFYHYGALHPILILTVHPWGRPVVC